MSQLYADCLREIFEYLADDKITLHSCILVNRLWCEVSVRILWRNAWFYSDSNFETLIACLSNESKEILYENGIIISIPISKFPTFNYASFCRILPVGRVYCKLESLLTNRQQFISSQELKDNVSKIAQEIIKLIVKQIPSLKQLDVTKHLQFSVVQKPTTNFITYPKAKDCLKNLSELHCISGNSSEFFSQLSQVCCNILRLEIDIERDIPNGLVDLISAQKSLKYLCITIYNTPTYLVNLLTKKLPNTLTKLNLEGDEDVSLSFISKFTNLQELQLEFVFSEWFKDFEIIQNIIFSQLQILKFKFTVPRYELLVKFLENNGRNLREIYLCGYTDYSNNSLNLSIAKFCPFLRKLSTGIKNNDLETLKIIFHSCQYLESIKIWCGSLFLNENEALEAVTKYSKNILEIKLEYRGNVQFEIHPRELETFFVNWSKCSPQRSLSLVIIDNKYTINSLVKNENVKVIKKYIKLGIIKKFEVKKDDDKEFKPCI